MERQRNDRLGRKWQQPFQHRRQILRAIWCDSHAYSNCESNAYAYSNANCYSHTNAYANCYSHANAHTYGNSNANAESYADTAASPYASTAPLELNSE